MDIDKFAFDIDVFEERERKIMIVLHVVVQFVPDGGPFDMFRSYPCPKGLIPDRVKRANLVQVRANDAMFQFIQSFTAAKTAGKPAPMMHPTTDTAKNITFAE